MKPSALSVFLFLFFSPCLSELCYRNDKNTLLGIKKSLNNPSHLSSWTPQTDCCTNWTGVECSTINHQHRVTSLTVFYGEDEPETQIPPQIGDLPFLQYLKLETMNLTGTIPYSITKLKNLQHLRIIMNKLSGSIPEFISELKNLKTLHLWANRFTGPIPSSLSLLPNLEDLALNDNRLTGSIPESFGTFRRKLQGFYLYNNRLSGTIPQSLSKSSFDTINLSNNKLTGDASMLFGLNKTTRIIDLSDNKLEFDLSKVKFPRSLVYLHMSHNRIFGKLPEDLTKLPDLSSFGVAYNRLCGKIPVGGTLQSIDPMWFSHNRCLCGAPLKRRCK